MSFFTRTIYLVILINLLLSTVQTAQKEILKLNRRRNPEEFEDRVKGGSVKPEVSTEDSNTSKSSEDGIQMDTTVKSTNSITDTPYTQRPQGRMSRSNKNNDVGKLCLHEERQQCLISMLSKIAKVQFTGQSSPVSQNLKIFDVLHGRLGNLEVLKKSEDDEQPGDLLKKRLGNVFTNVSESNGPRKFHCHAIRDVYIPEVKEKIPAYACSFENRTFVLSSTRFFQDRRSYMDVEMDDDVAQRLEIAPKSTRASHLNVIPALLVLKVDGDNYTIRTSQNAVLNE